MRPVQSARAFATWTDNHAHPWDDRVRFSDDVELAEEGWIRRVSCGQFQPFPARRSGPVQAILLDWQAGWSRCVPLLVDGTAPGANGRSPLVSWRRSRHLYPFSALAPVTDRPAHYTFWMEEAP